MLAVTTADARYDALYEQWVGCNGESDRNSVFERVWDLVESEADPWRISRRRTMASVCGHAARYADEELSEAMMIVWRSLQAYKPERGHLRPYIWARLRFGLRNFWARHGLRDDLPFVVPQREYEAFRRWVTTCDRDAHGRPIADDMVDEELVRACWDAAMVCDMADDVADEEDGIWS